MYWEDEMGKEIYIYILKLRIYKEHCIIKTNMEKWKGQKYMDTPLEQKYNE